MRRSPISRIAMILVLAGLAPGCGSTSTETAARDASAPVDAHVVLDASGLGAFCDLPGSVVWSDGAPGVVEGSPQPDMTWLHLPDGFCAHYYGNVPETRLLRFAPNGDLFVASPSTSCAGGASGGYGSIVVLPDDDGNGVADKTVHYKDGLPSTQGLLFYGGYLYYQDDQRVMRTPYKLGDRAAPSPVEQLIDVTIYYSPTHWPKAIDVDDSGNVFVTNGGDQGEACEAALAEKDRPFHGGVLRIDGTPGGELIAKGLRNPIALRCARGTGACFGLELARDFAPQQGSREKLFPVRKGDDWGFPCCATANTPFSDLVPVPSCTSVQAETGSFIIDHTPFDLDFEQGSWPGSWKSRTFVVLHGFVGSWLGARIVAIATDPKTGWPVPSSEADPGTVFSDFGTGWFDDQAGTETGHGRPATVAFAPDGRMFVGNDINGDIFWVAPVGSGDR